MRTFVPIIEHKKYKLKNFILKPIASYSAYVLHVLIDDVVVGYVDTTTPTTAKENNKFVLRYFCVKNGYHQRIGKTTFEYKIEIKRWSLKKVEINNLTHDFLVRRKVLFEKKIIKQC